MVAKSSTTANPSIRRFRASLEGGVQEHTATMNGLEYQLGAWGLFASALISATLAPGGSEAVLALLVTKSDIAPAQLLWVATAGCSDDMAFGAIGCNGLYG